MAVPAHESVDVVKSGYAIPTPQELYEVQLAVMLERPWMDGLPRYGTNEDLLKAAEAGLLVNVHETANFRPLPSITNPGPHRQSFPFLLPEAHVALVNFSQAWREKAWAMGIPDDVKLSVTSLARSTQRQQELLAQGKLAVEDSSHERCSAWDIAAADYYIVNALEIISVSLRPPEMARPFEEAYRAMGAPLVQTKRLGPEHFDYRVQVALKEVAAQWHAMGLVNAVDEFEKSHPDNEIIHFGVNVRQFHTQ